MMMMMMMMTMVLLSRLVFFSSNFVRVQLEKMLEKKLLNCDGDDDDNIITSGHFPRIQSFRGLQKRLKEAS